MAVFTKEKINKEEVMQDGKMVTMEEEVEAVYIETEMDGKRVAVEVDIDDMDAIYDIVSTEIVEDALYEYVHKKDEERCSQIMDSLMENEMEVQALVQDIQETSQRLLDQNMNMIMEYCLMKHLPVKYK